MTELNNNTYQQVYNVREDDTLSSKAELVVCVLMQRSMFIAGFDGNKGLLTIQYAGYNKSKVVWDLDFFEHMFATKPLLAAREKIKAIFICNDKNMVVPEELYQEAAAKSWLKHIHFVEQTDTVTAAPIAEGKAQYMLAVPMKITELVKINFKKSVVLPLPLYQFLKNGQQSLHLQCCISNEQVCATLHNYSQLLWHKVFTYTCAEDIAFEVKHLCMENNISPSKISMACNAMSATEYDMINDLSQYYPGVKCGDGTTIHGRWDPAISLAKQLLACV